MRYKMSYSVRSVKWLSSLPLLISLTLNKEFLLHIGVIRVRVKAPIASKPELKHNSK